MDNNKKILEIVPEYLRADLIEEVKELITKQEKEKASKPLTQEEIDTIIGRI